MSKKVNKARLFRNIILLLLVVGCIGLYFSNRYVKTKGFDNIGDFISTYQDNKSLADNVDAELMQLIISDADYQFLEDKREESLARGIQVNKGDNYVDCKVVFNGDTIEGEMRLKGHMTDHLEGDKWSFRVKAKDEVKGMYRFSLQNPATRNYAYEWVYHQLLENEEVIHLKYDFITLKLNNKDLGVYAIEEHFGQHVIEDNGRHPGAILRWNPELYWEHRLDELDGLYLDEAYSDYSSSFPEAYDRGTVKRDDQLTETYITGATLLEAFRRGEKPTSEVFDIEKMARFHAVIDLVGGYHSLDWSDVKFYYNPETKKIEPVGYESFSVRETIKIAGQRTPEDYATVGFDYHDRLFADPEFFKVYIQNLQRICDEAYFREFTEEIQDELNVKRGVLAQEFAYIKFSFQPYYDNIERIRHNIELPKPFHAFLLESSDSLVTLSLAPVSDYPIQILGLLVDGKNHYSIAEELTLPPKPRNTFTHYFKAHFVCDEEKLKDLKVEAKIPGGNTIFQVEVADIPFFFEDKKELNHTLEVEQDSVLTWINDTIAILPEKQTFLSGLVKVPNGKRLVIRAGQEVIFKDEGKLNVSGEIVLLGSETNEVMISGENREKTWSCIDLKSGKLTAIHTQFYNLKTVFLNIDNGVAEFQECTIADTEVDFIQGKLSTIKIIGGASGTMNGLGSFDRCLLRLKGFSANNGQVFISASGSDIEMHQSKISGYQNVSSLDYQSDFSSWSSIFEDNGLLSELNNGAQFKTYVSTINSGEKGFSVDLDATFPGSASYLLYKTPSNKLKNLEHRKS